MLAFWAHKLLMLDWMQDFDWQHRLIPVEVSLSALIVVIIANSVLAVTSGEKRLDERHITDNSGIYRKQALWATWEFGSLV